MYSLIELSAAIKPEQVIEALKDKKHVFFLDSAKHHSKLGRYSYIGFDPIATYEVKGKQIRVEDEGRSFEVSENAFTALETLFSKYKISYQAPFPFIGGMVGYLGYDLCHHVERLPQKAIDDVEIPDAFLGLYDGVYIFDHQENKVYAAALGIKEDPACILNRLSVLIESLEATHESKWLENETCYATSNVKKEDYLQSVESVRRHIWNGDLYQVNYTQRFTVPLTVEAWEIYKKLRHVNAAPFAAYIDFGTGVIASSSPERFIKIENGLIETRPIKGTRPRIKDNEKLDQMMQEELLNSEKDQSELLMIVDLERNDIGRVAKIGTVKVPELFCLETYETVHHLVSTVTGELQDGKTAIDCLKATFPGGSITGAPKIKAMEVIDALEPNTRNVYTGSIGFIGLNGDMDFNIVIRTMVVKDQKAFFSAGGGVVWDSDPLSEYEESLAKAKALLATLNAKVCETCI